MTVVHALVQPLSHMLSICVYIVTWMWFMPWSSHFIIPYCYLCYLYMLMEWRDCGSCLGRATVSFPYAIYICLYSDVTVGHALVQPLCPSPMLSIYVYGVTWLWFMPWSSHCFLPLCYLHVFIEWRDCGSCLGPATVSFPYAIYICL